MTGSNKIASASFSIETNPNIQNMRDIAEDAILAQNPDQLEMVQEAISNKGATCDLTTKAGIIIDLDCAER